MNEVELMNGCLAVAHSNLYIPSTLGGPVNDASGFNEVQLRKNLDLAADVYISRVQGAPCGEANIHLFKGASDAEARKPLDRRTMLITFLSGKAEEKKELHNKNIQMTMHIFRRFGMYTTVTRELIFQTSIFYFFLCATRRTARTQSVKLPNQAIVVGTKVDLC